MFPPQAPQASLPHDLSPVQPVLAQRGRFRPEVGGSVSVTLDGEIVRVEVTQVHGPHAFIGRITSLVVDKSGHGFKRNSIVACQRKFNGLSETWEPISDREAREREAAELAVASLKAPPQAPEPSDVEDAPAPVQTDAPPRKVLGPRRSKVARSA